MSGVCPAGFHCETATNLCAEGATMCGGAAPACPAGQTCAGGACLCQTDEGCADGDRCSAGRCEERTCTSDDECAAGTICESRECVAGCRSGRDCGGETPLCDEDAGAHGKCVACLTAADCGGAACTAGVCEIPPTDDLDVLFVVDNSNSMEEEQAALVAAFDSFVDALGTPLPNLHIGVVSSDLGISPHDAESCFNTGNNAILQNTARGACSPPRDGARFIEDLAATGGGRTKNYDGDLEDVFACIAPLGVDGCGLERHLDAVKGALDGSRAQNAGFLREDAHLAVIIFADEDDCSADDPTVYDTAASLDSATSSLGYFHSFRCAEFGVRCDGANLQRGAARSYTTCEPRTDSYLVDPADTVAFLRDLKGAGRVTVGVIAGRTTPFMTTINASGRTALAPSCTGTGGGAAPAVRLDAFAKAFGAHGAAKSICDGDLSLALGDLAGLIREDMGR